MDKNPYVLNNQDISFFRKKFYVWRFFDIYKTQKIYQHMKTFACVASTDGYERSDFFEYSLNKYGFRSDEFNKEPIDFLYVGCSETFGQGGTIEESWPHILNKKLNNSGPYINLGVPGAGWTEIISNVFTYIENFGAPKNIFMLLPNIERRTVYGYMPNAVLSKIKLFKNKIKEDKKQGIGYHMWWFPGMSNNGNKYPKKYRLDHHQYKTLILQRYEQVKMLSKLCNILNIKLVFAVNSDVENSSFNLIKYASHENLGSFFYLDNARYFNQEGLFENKKYDGHNSIEWHQFVAEEMYKNWNIK